MLNFTDVAIRRGTRLLFSGATFSLFRGEKVGITGANGSGKSSLLGLVQGELQPDAGKFEMPSQLRSRTSRRNCSRAERQAIEFVLDGDAELRAIERDIETAAAAAPAQRAARTLASCTRAMPRRAAMTPAVAPAGCCMAWASHRAMKRARCASSPAAGACG